MNYPAISLLIDSAQTLKDSSTPREYMPYPDYVMVDAIPELRALLANEKKLTKQIEELKENETITKRLLDKNNLEIIWNQNPKIGCLRELK